jgi:hypothetical protein
MGDITDDVWGFIEGLGRLKDKQIEAIVTILFVFGFLFACLFWYLYL